MDVNGLVRIGDETLAALLAGTCLFCFPWFAFFGLGGEQGATPAMTVALCGVCAFTAWVCLLPVRAVVKWFTRRRPVPPRSARVQGMAIAVCCLLVVAGAIPMVRLLAGDLYASLSPWAFRSMAGLWSAALAMAAIVLMRGTGPKQRAGCFALGIYATVAVILGPLDIAA